MHAGIELLAAMEAACQGTQFVGSVPHSPSDEPSSSELTLEAPA